MNAKLIFDTRALSVFDELEFHVRDHTDDGDDHPDHAARRRYFEFEDAQGRALFVKLMNKIEKRRGWSGQADQAAASPAHRPHAETA